MKKRNICGIFATVFAIATVISLASCSQDDEYYYDSEMFTRADGMMTRDEGGPEIGGGNYQNPYEPCIIGNLNIPFFLKRNLRNNDGEMVIDSVVINTTVSFYVQLDTTGYFRSNWSCVGIDWANTHSCEPDAALTGISCLSKGKVKLYFQYYYDMYSASTDTVITINVRD